MADSVRLTDLVAGCTRRGAPLAPETGLFIALQSVESVRSAPSAVTVDSVRVTLEGTVDVQGAPATTEAGAVLGVASVLEVAVSPLPAGARDAIRRARAGELASLGDLHAEIEALLVPLNRGAARRVLGRLVREQQKERDAAGDSAPSGEGDGEGNAGVGAEALLSREKAPAGEGDELVPPLPPPPRLGSLASLQATLPTATDTEPDGRPAGALSSAIDTEPEGKTTKAARGAKPATAATDTIPDGATALASDDGAGDDASDGAGDDASPRRVESPGARMVSSVLLWLAGLLVGGALLFLVLRILGR